MEDSSAAPDDYVLQALFRDTAVHSAMDHERLLSSSQRHREVRLDVSFNFFFKKNNIKNGDGGRFSANGCRAGGKARR